MAERKAGGIDAEVIAVCWHYLGRPERREGAPGSPGELAVWHCGECGGDFVASGGRAGCPEPGCAAPRDADAFDLVAFFEGKPKSKNLRVIIQKVRGLAAAHSAAVARVRARARAQAEERAREARASGDGRGDEGADDEPDAGGRGLRETGRGGPQVRTGDGSAGRGPKRSSEAGNPPFDAVRRDEGESASWREERRREADEQHRVLADRTVAALAWATPGELAEAAAVALGAGFLVWAALTGIEAAYDLAAGFLGGTGPADHEVVGRLEVGQLPGHPPVDADAKPPFSWASIRERLAEGLAETLQEHRRLLLGAVVGAGAGVARGWRRSADRRAAHAFAPHERLRLRADGEEG